MSVRPYRDIHRRACRQIHVGKVPVGGDTPITVQSMTNTVTSDIAGTVAQVRALEAAGADIVRVSCPDQESALALKEIVRQVTVPSSPTFTSITNGRSRRRRAVRRACGSIPATSAQRSACAR